MWHGTPVAAFASREQLTILDRRCERAAEHRLVRNRDTDDQDQTSVVLLFYAFILAKVVY